MSNKFNAHAVVATEGKFDSRKEYRRYLELKLLEKAGKISNLQRQVSFTLIPAQYEYYEKYSKSGKRLKDGKVCVERSCVYKADFVYTDARGNKVVEDCKGFMGGAGYQLFCVKRKLMLQVHGIKVVEV